MGRRTFVALSVGLLSALGWAPKAHAALAESAGEAVVVSEQGGPIDGGGSRTVFSIRLPGGASCPGDSANDGYRVQSYMVPEAVRPEAVQYDGLGPTPLAAGAWERFRQPLYDIHTSSYASALTDLAPAPGMPGLIINIPSFNFAVYGKGDLPEGRYNVGIACTLGNGIKRYWNTQIAVTLASDDEPAGISWKRLGASASSGSGARMAVIGLGAVAVAGLGFVLSRRRAGRAQ